MGIIIKNLEVESTKLIVVYFFSLFVLMLLTSYELKVSDNHSPKECVRNEWGGYRWLGDGKGVYGFIFVK